MSTKFKVGDKVTVKQDLVGESELYYMENNSSYDSFCGDMLNFAGKQVTIKSISSGKYRIEEEDSNWTDGMFEDAVKELHFEKGDTLLCIRDVKDYFTGSKNYKCIDNHTLIDNDGERHCITPDFAYKHFELNQKSKFIVGKWYKTTGNTYGKFLKRDEIFEFISSERRISYYRKEIYSFNNGHIWTEVTDTSELDEFLPEGHPDRTKPKFKVGDWVYTIDTQPGYFKKRGDVFQITDMTSIYVYFESGRTVSVDRLRLAIESEIIEAKNALLVEEAKRRYPIGTKFFPAHINQINQSKEYCIVTTDNFYMIDNYIYVKTVDNKNWAFSSDISEGNTGFNRVVYDNGRWAEIYIEPVKPKEWEVGTYMVQTGETLNSRNIFLSTTKGNVYKITKCPSPSLIYIENDDGISINILTHADRDNIKWFATLQEAEAFAKTLKLKPLMLGEYYVVVGESTTSLFEKCKAVKIGCREFPYHVFKTLLTNFIAISDYAGRNHDTNIIRIRDIEVDYHKALDLLSFITNY